MYTRYKKSLEKIAMGLLSFMPNEKDVKKLQQTMKQYEAEPDWKLLLWKEEEDIVGLVGLVHYDDEKRILIQHVSVNPSYRQQGIGHKMLKTLREQYNEYTFESTKETASFLDHCNVSEIG
ncbi:GNAT family N-acetyltransferase [Bacillus fonticola]|uniref:GNAT family N-acetyltransferase n=1 Tax=Bacillus fonticola TaxID=2728853 RepID=UPI0014764521|nr:GNAT family N-acetyltransferase [Bacillus fonticola]